MLLLLLLIQVKLRAMFESFRRDAHLQLIFLRSLERIELHERKAGAARPSLRFSVQLGTAALNRVRATRQDFVKRTQSRDWLDKPIVRYWTGVAENY